MEISIIKKINREKMMSKKLSVSLWIIAFIFTLMIVFYQKITGPTYPVKGNNVLNGVKIKYKFLRSHTSFEKLPVKVYVPSKKIDGFLKFRKYKSNDKWTELKMDREGDYLIAYTPGLQSAGKIEYSVKISSGENSLILNNGITIIARFKNSVPPGFLITHIILMILSFFFGIRTGLEALSKYGSYYKLVNITLFIVFLGGMIFGPIVQKYAFGDLWTGIPFGYDLTDNKTLFAFIFWLLAYLLKKKSRWYVVSASALMILIYLIPHSVLGSEIDYKTGKMKNKFSSVQKIIYKYPTSVTAPALLK